MRAGDRNTTRYEDQTPLPIPRVSPEGNELLFLVEEGLVLECGGKAVWTEPHRIVLSVDNSRTIPRKGAIVNIYAQVSRRAAH